MSKIVVQKHLMAIKVSMENILGQKCLVIAKHWSFVAINVGRLFPPK
jgi:hypothetical protein